MINRAIYAGSFDPITNGHLEVIEAARNFVGELHVVIASNPKKKYFLADKERVRLARAVMESLEYDNVIVSNGSGELISRYAVCNDIRILIRGLRNTIDYTHECQMAHINNDAGLQTIFIPSFNTNAVSSSAVRELHQFGGNIADYVPEVIWRYLENDKHTG